jgi:serine/threonine protein kinase
VELTGEGLFITDKSSNGTYLQGLRLERGRRVHVAPDGVLRFGQHELTHTLADYKEDEQSYTQEVRLDDAALFNPSEFQLLELLGEGANGRVWAARQRPQNRLVAIKVYISENDVDATGRKRFLREGKLATRVRGPNVTEIYDVRIIGDIPIIIMELVQGPSAADRLGDGPMSIPGALKIGEDVARAMVVAQEHGIVHRDIKPHNVLLDPSGVAKLSDFGLAKEVGGGALTVQGQGMGSLHYAAPEQVLDASSVDSRTDVYGLAATLYHLIAGEPLFGNKSRGLVEAVNLIRKVNPPPLTERRPECPEPVARLIHAMLAKKPAQRQPTRFAEIAGHLAQLRAKLYPRYRPGGDPTGIYETADE